MFQMIAIIPLHILLWQFQDHNHHFSIGKKLACRGAESDAAVSFPYFISPALQNLPDFDQKFLKQLIYKKKFCKNTTMAYQ